MKKNQIETNWENVPIDTSEYEAFVYLIINTITNKKYIGRKFVNQRRRKKVTKSVRHKLVITESDWKYYKSSSQDVLNDIEKFGIEKFKFIVLEWCKTRLQSMYLEVEYQVKNDVLSKQLDNGEFEYYNTNIMNKFFRSKLLNNISNNSKFLE